MVFHPEIKWQNPEIWARGTPCLPVPPKFRRFCIEVLLEKEKMTNIVKEQITQMKQEFNNAREKQEEDARAMEQEKVQFEEEIKRLTQENRVLQVEKAGVTQQLNAMNHQMKNTSHDGNKK